MSISSIGLNRLIAESVLKKIKVYVKILKNTVKGAFVI